MRKDQLKIQLISSSDQFMNLREDWNLLLQESSTPQPFLCWEWMYTWWETYQNSKTDLFILAIFEQQKLVAIAPFYIQSISPFVNCLRMLGEGEKVTDRVVTVYPDIIVNKNYIKEAVSLFSDYIKESKGSRFNMASFNLVKKDSVLSQISKPIGKEFSSYLEPSESQFLIELPSDHETYINSLSRSTRKQFRMKLKRIEKAGELEISSENSLPKGLEIIEELHRKRWEERADHNVFDSKKFKQFHQKLCERFENQDVMQIRVMKHDDDVIAASYNLSYNDKMYSYLSGFSSSDDNRFSPMFVFDLLETEHLINNGYSHYDLLTSESTNSYKSKFNATTNQVYKMYWLEKGVVSVTVSNYLKIRPFLAKTYHALKRPINLPVNG